MRVIIDPKLPNPQHGDTSDLTFHDGDILMWAWDADNDKIYFGHNGWYNNADPAAGTGHIIEGGYPHLVFILN